MSEWVLSSSVGRLLSSSIVKTLQNWSLNLSALFGPAFAKAKVKVSQFLREGNTMPAMLFVQTLVQLKAQFQLPFCSHCTQLTVEALMSRVL